MPIFNWFNGNGDLRNPADWGPQPDPDNPVVPGPGDVANIGGGVLTGSDTARVVNLTGGVTLDGNLTGVDAVNVADSDLDITNGGVLTGGGINLNDGADVTVEIPTSALNANGPLNVGIGGAATLTVQRFGDVSADGGVDIGVNAGDDGQVSVTSAGQLISLAGVVVADAGLGSLIAFDGILGSAALTIGNQFGSNGAVFLDEASQWITAGVSVGNAGTGSLVLENLSSLSASSMILGVFANANGTVLVDDSSILGSPVINVGFHGTASMNLRNGALVTATQLNVGYSLGDSADADGNLVFGDLLTVNDSSLAVTGAVVLGTALQDGLLTANFTDANVTAGNFLVAENTDPGSDVEVDVDHSTINAAQGFTIGDVGDANLDVSDGSSIVSQVSAVGNQPGADGGAIVDASTWTANDFVVGGGFNNGGVGNLMLQDGSVVTITGGGGVFVIGANAGSDGQVVVTGPAATLDASGSADDVLVVGQAGNGELDLQDQSHLLTQTAAIGSSAGSNGHVTLDDSGWLALQIFDGGFGDGVLNVQNSSALTTQGLDVGTNGVGQLNVSGGSTVLAFDLEAAGAAGSQGFVAVTGAGTTLNLWNGAKSMIIGNLGDGHLAVDDHAAVTADTVDISIGGIADAEISGGASLTVNKGLTVADAGQVQMHVKTGATVTTQTTAIANQAGSQAFVDIDDASWTANSFVIGGGSLNPSNPNLAGIANVTVEDGANLTVTGTGGTVFLGLQANGNGFVDVTGAGSVFDASGSADDVLNVGWIGQGEIDVEDGASLKSQTTVLGEFDGSSGKIKVDGTTAAASWTASSVTVGSDGVGTVDVEKQGTVSATDVTVAQFAGATTPSLVDVNAGALTVSQDLTVGAGAGIITSENGGTITVGNNLNLALQAGGSAQLVIDDAGANLSVGQFLNVGIAGSAVATFEDGAVVTADFVRIGGGVQSPGVPFPGNGNGDVKVSGAGTVLTVTSTDTARPGLAVGTTGHGTMEITNQGEVDVTTTTSVGLMPGSSGVLSVSGGGVLNTQNLTIGGGSTIGEAATVTVGAGGTINALAAGVPTVSASILMFSGSVLDVSQGGSVDAIAGAPAGAGPVAGAVHVAGSGILAGAGTIKGNVVDDNSVTAKGGNLTITGNVSGSVGTAGQLIINPTTTLELGGTDSVKVSFNHSAGPGIDTLKLDHPLSSGGQSNLTGHLTGMKVGDTIDLVGTSVSAVSITPGNGTTGPVINVTTPSQTLHYQVDGSLPTGARFNIVSDGNGGTNLVLSDIGMPSTTVTLANDTGASSTDFITQDGHVTLSGTLSGNVSGATVTVFDGATSLGNATVSGGTWTFSTDLTSAEGVHSFSARATSSDGGTARVSVGQSVTIDHTPPGVTFDSVTLAHDTGASSSDFVTSDGHVTLAGTVSDAIDSTSVTVFDDGAALGLATVANGTWTFSTDLTAVQGPHSFSVTASDVAGNTASASSAQTVTLDTTPPAVTAILADDTGSSASDGITSDPTVSGSGDPGATVNITLDGSPIAGPVTAAVDGSWSFLPTGLADGIHTLVATETDLAGNTGTASLTFMLDTIPPAVTESLAHDTGSSGTDNLTNDPTVTGSGDPNATVTLRAGGTVLGTTIADASGTWSLTPVGLADGGQTIVASETDAAGNTASASLTFTLDTTPPDTAIVSGPAALTTSTTASFTVSGTDAVGVAGFEYKLDNATSWTSTTSTAISFTGLAIGPHTVQVAAFDAAGNVDATPASYAWTVQSATVAPTVTSAQSSQGVFQAGSLVTFTLVMSEPVSVHGTPSLLLSNGGIATYDAGHSSATTLVFDYTVGKKDAATSSLAITAVNLNGGTVQDAAGNNVNFAGADTTLPGTYVNIDPNGANAISAGAGAVITLGNGRNTVTAGANSVITVGNGNNSVAAGANSTVTAGNGDNTVAAGAHSTIAVGNGNDTVTAGDNSTITAGNGHDTVFAGANDLIHLGVGQETVAFGDAPNSLTIGNEIVTGFDAHSSVIVFNPALFASFSAVIGAAKQVGQNTVITHDANDTVTLQNVSLSSLSANNVHFA